MRPLSGILILLLSVLFLSNFALAASRTITLGVPDSAKAFELGSVSLLGDYKVSAKTCIDDKGNANNGYCVFDFGEDGANAQVNGDFSNCYLEESDKADKLSITLKLQKLLIARKFFDEGVFLTYGENKPKFNEAGYTAQKLPAGLAKIWFEEGKFSKLPFMGLYVSKVLENNGKAYKKEEWANAREVKAELNIVENEVAAKRVHAPCSFAHRSDNLLVGTAVKINGMELDKYPGFQSIKSIEYDFGNYLVPLYVQEKNQQKMLVAGLKIPNVDDLAKSDFENVLKTVKEFTQDKPKEKAEFKRRMLQLLSSGFELKDGAEGKFILMQATSEIAEKPGFVITEGPNFALGGEAVISDSVTIVPSKPSEKDGLDARFKMEYKYGGLKSVTFAGSAVQKVYDWKALQYARSLKKEGITLGETLPDYGNFAAGSWTGEELELFKKVYEAECKDDKGSAKGICENLVTTVELNEPMKDFDNGDYHVRIVVESLVNNITVRLANPDAVGQFLLGLDQELTFAGTQFKVVDLGLDKVALQINKEECAPGVGACIISHNPGEDFASSSRLFNGADGAEYMLIASAPSQGIDLSQKQKFVVLTIIPIASLKVKLGKNLEGMMRKGVMKNVVFEKGVNGLSGRGYPIKYNFPDQIDFTAVFEKASFDFDFDFTAPGSAMVLEVYKLGLNEDADKALEKAKLVYASTYKVTEVDLQKAAVAIKQAKKAGLNVPLDQVVRVKAIGKESWFGVGNNNKPVSPGYYLMVVNLCIEESKAKELQVQSGSDWVDSGLKVREKELEEEKIGEVVAAAKQCTSNKWQKEAIVVKVNAFAGAYPDYKPAEKLKSVWDYKSKKTEEAAKKEAAAMGELKVTVVDAQARKGWTFGWYGDLYDNIFGGNPPAQRFFVFIGKDYSKPYPLKLESKSPPTWSRIFTLPAKGYRIDIADQIDESMRTWETANIVQVAAGQGTTFNAEYVADEKKVKEIEKRGGVGLATSVVISISLIEPFYKVNVKGLEYKVEINGKAQKPIILDYAGASWNYEVKAGMNKIVIVSPSGRHKLEYDIDVPAGQAYPLDINYKDVEEAGTRLPGPEVPQLKGPGSLGVVIKTGNSVSEVGKRFYVFINGEQKGAITMGIPAGIMEQIPLVSGDYKVLITSESGNKRLEKMASINPGESRDLVIGREEYFNKLADLNYDQPKYVPSSTLFLSVNPGGNAEALGKKYAVFLGEKKLDVIEIRNAYGVSARYFDLPYGEYILNIIGENNPKKYAIKMKVDEPNTDVVIDANTYCVNLADFKCKGIPVKFAVLAKIKDSALADNYETSKKYRDFTFKLDGQVMQISRPVSFFINSPPAYPAEIKWYFDNLELLVKEYTLTIEHPDLIPLTRKVGVSKVGEYNANTGKFEDVYKIPDFEFIINAG